MRFYQKRQTAAAVPIVPMIDILTILLIFFIIHTQWRKPRHYVKVDVATAEYLDTVKSDQSHDVLTVSADSVITLNGQVVEMDRLLDELKEYRKNNPGRKLNQDIDKKVSIEVLVKIYDALTGAGIDLTDVPFRIDIKSASKEK